MADADSPALLAAYVGGKQEAFAELVRRHVDLVYSTALRRVGGDAHLARDVVQLVFIDLALKAGSLPRGVVLGGWLHHHTCFRASTLVRSEQRRRAREEKAATMNALEKQSSDTWTQLAPHLDEALERLATRDRDLIVLRYFEGRPLAEIGRSCGLTEDAAQKAVSRALEKLRGYFLKRKLATASGALAAALAANSVQAAPAGLGTATTQFALAGATAAKAAAPAATFLTTLLMTTKTKIAVILAAGATGLALLVSTQRENIRLREELSTVQAANAAAQAANAARTPKSTLDRGKANGADALPVPPLPSEDVEALLARVIEDRLWRSGGRAFDQLLQSIDARDMPRALAFVNRTATGESRRHLVRVLVDRWAGKAPAAASAWSDTLPHNYERNDLKNIIANRWAEQDPREALRGAGPNPGVFDALTRLAPVEAAVKALDVPDGPTRRMAIHTVAQRWFEDDSEASVKWINTLVDFGDQASALEAIIRPVAETNPEAIAAYIVNLPQDPRFSELVGNFAEYWADAQPAAAAAWSATLPAGSVLREKAIPRIAGRWGAENPKAAAAWLDTLTGQTREAAIQAFLGPAAGYKPQLAAQWATTLAQENSRHDAIEHVAHEWLGIDANAARKWLAQTTLPEDRKQKVLATR